MLLRHATPARNVNSILRRGLLCSYSKGKLPVVWVCTPARSWWAVLHVIERHGGGVETGVVLEIGEPQSWLRKNRKGLWSSVHDVPADRIRRVLAFSELAGPSAAWFPPSPPGLAPARRRPGREAKTMKTCVLIYRAVSVAAYLLRLAHRGIRRR